MRIREVRTGIEREVSASVVIKEDFKNISTKRHFFNWREASVNYTLYKLCLLDDDDILGLMALQDFPEEQRVEVKLIACSVENVGKRKKFENIAGCLLAFSGRESIKKYGVNACISLLPKTELYEHYREKYGMLSAGLQLFVEGESLVQLINKFLK